MNYFCIQDTTSIRSSSSPSIDLIKKRFKKRFIFPPPQDEKISSHSTVKIFIQRINLFFLILLFGGLLLLAGDDALVLLLNLGFLLAGHEFLQLFLRDGGQVP